jgi:hypothetical protein
MIAPTQRGRTNVGTASVYSRPKYVVPPRGVDDAVLDADRSPIEEGWRTAIDDLLKYRNYSDDWDGDGAAAIPADVVYSAIRLAQRLQRDGHPPPSCTLPGVNGTVSFEWVVLGGRLEIEVLEPHIARVVEAFPDEPVRSWVLEGRA